MATINNVWLLVQNTTGQDHGSNNQLELTFVTAGKDVELDTSRATAVSPSPSAAGGAYQFAWNSGQWSGVIDRGDISEITLEIEGNDAWLPASIWVLVETENGYSVMVAQPEWPDEGWFSTDPNDGGGNAHPEYNLRTAEPA
jgi:hypothetical protein